MAIDVDRVRSESFPHLIAEFQELTSSGSGKVLAHIANGRGSAVALLCLIVMTCLRTRQLRTIDLSHPLTHTFEPRRCLSLLGQVHHVIIPRF